MMAHYRRMRLDGVRKITTIVSQNSKRRVRDLKLEPTESRPKLLPTWPRYGIGVLGSEQSA